MTIASLRDLQEFDENQLSFGPLRKPESGIKTAVTARPSRVQIRYKGEPLKLQSGMMYLPFKFEPEPTNNSLTFCTKAGSLSQDQLAYNDAMIKVLKIVQAKAFEVSKQNAQEWFNQSSETFGDLPDNFSFPLREASEGRYPPHLKVKYYRDNTGLPQFPVYDGKTMTLMHSRQQPSEKIKCDELFAVNTRHIVIMDCTGIWSLNRRGGLTWRMNDVLCYGPVEEFPFKGVTADQFADEFAETSVYKSAPVLPETNDEELQEPDEA